MSKRKRPQQPVKPANQDSQTVEMLTVFWMLSVTTALLCEVGFAFTRGYVLLVDATAARMMLFAGMLLFAAGVVGLVSLVLCAAVIKLRKVPPPTGVIAGAVVIGAIPLVAMLVGTLRQH